MKKVYAICFIVLEERREAHRTCRSHKDFSFIKSYLFNVCYTSFSTDGILFFRSYHRRQMSAQGWCNAITLTAQLSARTRQQRYGAFAPQRMPAAPKEGDRHLLRDLAFSEKMWEKWKKLWEKCGEKWERSSTAWSSFAFFVIVLWNRCPATHQGQCFTRYLINGNAIFRSVAEAILLAKHEIFILSFYGQPMVNFLKVFHTMFHHAVCFTPAYCVLCKFDDSFFAHASHEIEVFSWVLTSNWYEMVDLHFQV